MATKKVNPDVTVAGIPLDAFSAKVDAHLGEQADFAGTIRHLAVVRAQKAIIDGRRKPIYEVCKALAESGREVRYGDKVLVRTTAAAPVVKTSVPAAVIKKHDPRLWADSRLIRPFVSLKAVGAEGDMVTARAEVAVGKLGRLPAIPDGRRSDEAAAALMAMPPVTPLTAQETELVAALRDIARRAGWDGLPYVFSDGWTAQLNQLQYNSDRLQVIAPELWDKLAVQTTTTPAPRWYFKTVGDDDDEGSDGEHGYGL